MHALALLSLATAALAQHKGFNYGAKNNDGSYRVVEDFTNEFNRAKNLQGQSGFTSARLYTMIQGEGGNTVTSAIQAAINTNTSLLLGLWASTPQDGFNNELTALTNAINQYGTQLTDLIVGISVGSEDLYRNSPTGIKNVAGLGAGPDQLVNYIGQVRNAIRNTKASAARVGHVDTWNDWVNASNSAVIDAVDWIGMDGYPYFENTVPNGIENGEALFFESYNKTVAVSGGKEVWITETGWPTQGKTEGNAVPSPQNAEIYWQHVACRVLGNINTWWYTLHDPQSGDTPSFGVVGNDLNSAPLYNLTCSNGNAQPTSTMSINTPSSSAAAPTKPATTPTAASPSVNVKPGPEAQPSSYASSAPPPSTFVTSTSCPPTAGSSVPTPSPPAASSPATSGKHCATNLSGQYEFPHLIVPVDSASPNKAYNTSYYGEITPDISSIFDFDFPPATAGKTCSLVFLFPMQKDLETSSFTFNGKGGIQVTELKSPATALTTYANKPAAGGHSQSLPSVAPGNEYLVFSEDCAAGHRIGYEFASTGGLNLTYFQDFNPSPIGAYINVC